jgi:hypothetical protein
MQHVDVASVRLAYSNHDHRVYVGVAGPGDSLFLWSESTCGGGAASVPERRSLRTARASRAARDEGLRTEEREVVGIDADEVTAVHVGGTEAVLTNNVFIAAFDSVR